MAEFKALSTGAKVALLAGGAALAALAGYSGWVVSRSSPSMLAAPANPPTDTAVSTQTTTAEPVATNLNAAADAIATPDPQTAAEAPVVPSFDVVRIEPDGSTVVAGKAEPGSKIVLRIDGSEISATTADANGNFVGLFVQDNSQSPRMLTMTSILPDQTEVAAAAEVAIAPTEAPVVVAAVTPDPTGTETITASPAEPPVATVPDAPAALLVTKDGVKVLQPRDQPAASGPVADLTIDTISYTPAGDVQLAGHAAAGAVLRIYLDNAPLIDVTAGEDGLWASTMPPVVPGIYTLRVDQLTADGSVTARFETPFKRETQDALAAATQTPDIAVDVAVAEPQPATAPAVADSAPVAEPLAEPVIEATAEPVPAAQSGEPAVAQPVTIAEAAPERPVSITVQPGFTLWGIASKQFGDGVMYVQVFEANKDKIRDPNLIYPGQVFVIPTASE